MVNAASRPNALTSVVIDRTLVLLGALGLALGALILTVIVVRGNTLIEPEGDLTKSLTFDIAVGIYYLTLSFFLPLAGFSARGRALWLTAAFLFTVYGYSVETVQIFRGFDPRFSDVNSSADEIVGGLFAFTAIGQIVVFLVLAVRFFRAPSSLLVLGIRYAALATVIAFAVGIWMSALGSRETGAEGNLLVLHALGFHGLQAIPLLAWLLERTPSLRQPKRWVHIGGLAWIAACLTVAWQASAGRAPADLSPASAASILLLTVWAVAIGTAAYIWLRDRRPLHPARLSRDLV